MYQTEEKAIAAAKQMARKQGLSRVVFFEDGEFYHCVDWMADEQLTPDQWRHATIIDSFGQVESIN